MNSNPALYDSEDLQEHYGATAPSPQLPQAGTSDSLALGSDYYVGIASPSGDDWGTPAAAVSNWTLQSPSPHYSAYGDSSAFTGESFTADDYYPEGTQPAQPRHALPSAGDSDFGYEPSPYEQTQPTYVADSSGRGSAGEGALGYSAPSSEPTHGYSEDPAGPYSYAQSFITDYEGPYGESSAVPQRRTDIPQAEVSSAHLPEQGAPWASLHSQQGPRDAGITWTSRSNWDTGDATAGSSLTSHVPDTSAAVASYPNPHGDLGTTSAEANRFPPPLGEEAQPAHTFGTPAAGAYDDTVDESYYDDHGASEHEGSQAQSGMASHVIGSSAAVTVPAGFVRQEDGTYAGPLDGRYTATEVFHKGHRVFSYQDGRGETRYVTFNGNKRTRVTRAQAGVELKRASFLREGDIVRSVWPAGTNRKAHQYSRIDGLHTRKDGLEVFQHDPDDRTYYTFSGDPIKRTRVAARDTTWSNTLEQYADAPSGPTAPPKRREPRNKSEHMQTGEHQFVPCDPSSEYHASSVPTHDTFEQITWKSIISYDPKTGHSGSSAPTAGANAQSSSASYEGQYGETSRAPQRRADASRAEVSSARLPQQRVPRASRHSRDQGHGNEMTVAHRGR